MQPIEIDKISNTCAELVNMPIGTRFVVKNDPYGDTYEIVDIMQEPQIFDVVPEERNRGREAIRNVTLATRCNTCIFHWRQCYYLSEPGPLFCRPIEDHGTRTDGKLVHFKRVKE